MRGPSFRGRKTPARALGYGIQPNQASNGDFPTSAAKSCKASQRRGEASMLACLILPNRLGLPGALLGPFRLGPFPPCP